MQDPTSQYETRDQQYLLNGKQRDAIIELLGKLYYEEDACVSDKYDRVIEEIFERLGETIYK